MVMTNEESRGHALQEAAESTAYRARRQARRMRREVGDALDAGVHDARRTLRRGRHAAEDVFDEVEATIRRVPVRSVLAGFATGTAVGVLMMWLVRRRPEPEA